MPKHVVITIADRSGDPVEVSLFSEAMADLGWQPVNGLQFCFTRLLEGKPTSDELAAQITADLEQAGHRADWGRTQAAFVVSEEAPRLLPIDPWKGPEP
jgi:hypothetical protein